MTLYNHMFTIAFSVETQNDGENVTGPELIAGLASRLRGLLECDDTDGEIQEACGLPTDTYIVEEN